jgi:hypothetical protein
MYIARCRCSVSSALLRLLQILVLYRGDNTAQLPAFLEAEMRADEADMSAAVLCVSRVYSVVRNHVRCVLSFCIY